MYLKTVKTLIKLRNFLLKINVTEESFKNDLNLDIFPLNLQFQICSNLSTNSLKNIT